MKKLHVFQTSMPMGDYEVKILNPCEDDAYKEWIVGRSDGTIFHSPNWAKVLCDSYGYHPRYIVLRKNGLIRACLPLMEVNSVFTGKRGVSLCFSDYCPAIIENEEEFAILLDSAISYGRLQGWRYAEFRGQSLLCEVKASKEFVQHTLQLEEEDVMHSKLRSSSARNIHKAIKEGVLAEIRDDLGGLLSFYRLQCLTRKRQGLPPQPKKYFVNLYRNVFIHGLGFTVLALYRGIPVAGLVCLHYGNNAIYKYGASDERFQSLRPNNLLFWEMIKKCIRDGFTSLSLGRTDLANSGLILFKDGWGCNRSNLQYHKYDFSHSVFEADIKQMDKYNVFFKKMPVHILKLIGYLGYRHIG